MADVSQAARIARTIFTGTTVSHEYHVLGVHSGDSDKAMFLPCATALLVNLKCPTPGALCLLYFAASWRLHKNAVLPAACDSGIPSGRHPVLIIRSPTNIRGYREGLITGRDLNDDIISCSHASPKHRKASRCRHFTYF